MFWFVIHTKPRQELRALHNLQQQGYECYLPQIRSERVKLASLSEASEPLFPRYLFIRLDPSLTGKSWSPIRSTKGVSRLVAFGGAPAQVGDALVAELRREDTSRATRPLFAAGERVELGEGPFAGLQAVFQMADGEARAMVLLELLSRQVRLQVPARALRRVV